MKDLNQFNFTGKIITDVEMRYTPGGMAIARMVVAIADDKYDKENEKWINKSHIVSVTFFKETAEGVAQRFEKFDRVQCTVQVQQDSYTDKEGVERKGFQFIGNSFPLLMEKAKPRTASQEPTAEDVSEEDAPF